MSGHPLWTFVNALRTSLAGGDDALLKSIFDDEIDWAIFGPIDMFPYLGSRQGKESVLDAIDRISGSFRLQKATHEDVVLGENSASALLRCSLNTSDGNRPISVRIATFLKFREGKLLSLRTVIDTFDLVEQALGRPIHLPELA